MTGAQERQLLQDMLERYSPTGQERAVAEYLVQRFREAGLEAGCDEAGNFVGTVGTGPVEVALLGHIDTVPGEIPVVEREGRLWGRGAVDAKGPMAMFACAALRLASNGGPRNLRLLVMGAVGEEGGSEGARHLAGEYTPKHLVIGEPGGWDSLVLGYKGSLRVSYELRRTARHSAGPDESVPEVAIAFWQKVKSACEENNAGKRAFDQISPSLRAINTSGDGLEDRVVMDIGVRLPLDCDPRTLERQMREWTGPAATLQVWFGDPAVKGEKNTQLVRSFLAAVREYGTQPRFKVKTGTSDMNVVAPVWNCPMLAYGPGDSALDHTPEEHIELEEYDRAIAVLERALINLDEAVGR
ncbi:MAG: [LysW]-lysine hydrolase [Chloroflexota bacterium]|nr:[LysW]-lysine hydrolase [Chloroflexota bacterium]